MNWKFLLKWIYDRPLEKGAFLGDTYKIDKCVGMGGYGIIYKCTNIKTGQQYVAKQLRPSKALKLKERQRFLSEIDLLASLHHKQIPRLVDTIHSDKEAFYIMEYVEGLNIEDLLFYQKQTFSELEALKLIDKLLTAVDYLHKEHIFHDDIRPPNILLKGDNLYLIDFGLAKKVSDSKAALERKQDDFYDIGECLLFLLYSTYTGKRKRKGSWLDELVLNDATVELLKKLLGIDEGYPDVPSLREDLDRTIKKLLLL